MTASLSRSSGARWSFTLFCFSFLSSVALCLCVRNFYFTQSHGEHKGRTNVHYTRHWFYQDIGMYRRWRVPEAFTHLTFTYCAGEVGYGHITRAGHGYLLPLAIPRFVERTRSRRGDLPASMRRCNPTWARRIPQDLRESTSLVSGDPTREDRESSSRITPGAFP